MRKTIIILCCIIFAMTGSLQSYGQQAKDTIFLARDIDNAVYHAVFIDTNKASGFYSDISNFEFNEYDSNSYLLSLEYLRAKHLNLVKLPIQDIPLKWIKLEYYKGNFYAYYPSDFISHYQAAITDTSFIDYTGEGPIAGKINSFKKIDNETFSINTTSMDQIDRSLIIHIIDSKKGIAVFENANTDGYYWLMIDADHIRDVPVIVNYCETQKCVEFKFEEPDYKKLIDAAKSK